MSLTRDPGKARAWRLRSKALKRRPWRRTLSAKAQRFAAELEAAKPIVAARSGGWCEAGTPKCRGFGQHYHHRAGRVGPGVNHPDLILHVCWACHRYLHANPAEAYVRGWLVKRLGVAA